MPMKERSAILTVKQFYIAIIWNPIPIAFILETSNPSALFADRAETLAVSVISKRPL